MKNAGGMVVVITGASSGIGRATALGIASRGGSVVLASRQEDALNELAAECERRGGKALAVKTDVADEGQVIELGRRAQAHFSRIDAWVNAAAVGMLARFEEAPPDAFRQVVETDFFGYVHGARAALPHFRRQGHGVLINVSSEVGKVGVPYASAYVASKFAVTGFSESLRLELRDAPGIHVCTIFPASIDTPFFQHAANFTGRAVRAMPPVYEPEAVAEAILGCIEKPRREVPVGNVRRMVALRRLAPPLADKLIATKMHNQHFQDRPAPPTPGSLFQPMPGFNSVHGGWSDGQSNGAGKTWLGAALAALGGALVIAALLRRPGAPARLLRSGMKLARDPRVAAAARAGLRLATAR